MAKYQMSIRVKGTEDLEMKLERASEQAIKQTQLVIKEVAYGAEGDIKRELGRRTGRLKRSIHTVVKGLSASVGTALKYAPFVDLGFKPHIIKPKGRVLVFFAGGSWKFRSIVHHPGFRGYHAFDKAIVIAKSRMGARLKTASVKIERNI